MAAFPSPLTHRPPILGTRYMASTGHYLATMAAVRILERGGNAIDAGVTAGLCINVLQPDMTNIGGVAPIMLYSARDGQPYTISGLGSWPHAVSRDYFVTECEGAIPPGVHRCVMPAAMDAWLTALERFGTMSLAAQRQEREHAARRERLASRIVDAIDANRDEANRNAAIGAVRAILRDAESGGDIGMGIAAGVYRSRDHEHADDLDRSEGCGLPHPASGP